MAQQTASLIEKKPDGSPYSFYIIDDSEFMVTTLKKMVLEVGGTVAGAQTSSLKALDEVASKPDMMDIIFLDLQMPEMDGFELLPQLKRINPNLKIIIASALGFEDKVMNCIYQGADHFLVKPFRNSDFFNIVSKVCNQVGLNKINKTVSENSLGSKPDGTPFRFFVIDDSEFMLQLLSKMITEIGGEVKGSDTSGFNAINILNKIDKEVDVILLDIMMPELDGFTLLPRIREINPAFKIIMVSSDKSEERYKESNDLGADGFIPKPFHKDTFYKSIKEICHLNHLVLNKDDLPPKVFIFYSDFEIVSTLEQKLKRFNCQVIGSSTATTASLVNIKPFKGNVDLLIIEMTPPECSELDLLPHIKLLCPEVKILATSEDYSPDFVAKAFKVGANHFIAFPPDDSKLFGTLKSLF